MIQSSSRSGYQYKSIENIDSKRISFSLEEDLMILEPDIIFLSIVQHQYQYIFTITHTLTHAHTRTHPRTQLNAKYTMINGTRRTMIPHKRNIAGRGDQC